MNLKVLPNSTSITKDINNFKVQGSGMTLGSMSETRSSRTSTETIDCNRNTKSSRDWIVSVRLNKKRTEIGLDRSKILWRRTMFNL
jgi:hypothetical protein